MREWTKVITCPQDGCRERITVCFEEEHATRLDPGHLDVYVHLACCGHFELTESQQTTLRMAAYEDWGENGDDLHDDWGEPVKEGKGP